mgnify:CR=1 FL=1
MGPRFCKRGNKEVLQALLENPFLLQWGHAFVSVETFTRPESTINAMMLQWGHAFVSVETQAGVDYPVHLVSASMGPRFCKRGNQAESERQKALRMQASMGPRFCKRGNTGQSYRYHFAAASFNGATLL